MTTVTSTAPDGTVTTNALDAAKAANAKATLLWEVQYGLQELAEKATQERRSNITPGLWQAVAFVQTLLASADVEKNRLLDLSMEELDGIVSRYSSLITPADKH